MNILYHLTVLPPKMPQAEALSQEITALRHHFSGQLNYLNPNQHSPIYIPRFLFGFHKLKQLRKMEPEFDLHHLYNPDAFAFPILQQLKRPVIYTISSGVGKRRPNIKFFDALAAITVPDERSLAQLKRWGLTNVYLVRAGIDTDRFSTAPLPLKSEIRLMIGSAPWTMAQFKTKGINALLEAARLNPKLQLIFLWRGVLTNEMHQKIKHFGVKKQVEVIDEQVDVNEILATVHGSVTLAVRPGIVKSYPHSLLDSLAAGKPVLVSRAIPMADYVENVGCGEIIEDVSAESLLASIEDFVQKYNALRSVAQIVGRKDFSQKEMFASYQAVYEYATGNLNNEIN